MRLIIKRDYDSCAKWTSKYIADSINNFSPTKSKPYVLGLPTGSTPIGVYKELVDMFNRGEVSFENVITFNMDEYVGLSPDNEHSYHYFMWENFFQHIDIKEGNINILNGLADDLDLECKNYEDKIKKYGGIKLFFGGVGTDGHIAFNEPYSSLTSRTRVNILNIATIRDNSRFFNHNLNLTPKIALTVGVGTIMDAKEVVIMATGLSKAAAVQQAVEGPVSQSYTISALQMHSNATIVCDEDATNELKVKTVNYFKNMEK